MEIEGGGNEEGQRDGIKQRQRETPVTPRGFNNCFRL